MKKETQYYNYIYLDPRKPGRYSYENLNFCLLYEPFYVGKGKNNRYLDHINEAKKEKSRNLYKINKINKILELNYNMNDFILRLNFTNIEQESLDYEIRLIEEIGLENLTNITPGGEGGNKGTYYYDTILKKNVLLFDSKNIDKDRYIHYINVYHKDNLEEPLRILHTDYIKSKNDYITSSKINGLSGINNPNSIIINIYDNNNILKYTSDDSINKFLSKHNLPLIFINSYQENGSPIHVKNKDSEYHLWYALKENNIRDTKWVNKKTINRSTFKLTVYDSNNNIFDIKQENENINEFCKRIGITTHALSISYKEKGKLLFMTKKSHKFKGFYCLKDNDIQDNKWITFDYNLKLKNAILHTAMNNKIKQYRVSYYKIFDKNNNLVFTTDIKLKDFCDKYDLPYLSLKKSSYINKPIFTTKNSLIQVDEKYHKYQGWYAIKISK